MDAAWRKSALDAGRKRPMIFVVDDDGGVRDSLRLLLECEGLEAREFASCEAFLNAGGAGVGDCLILDVHMPGMSGIELLETMRRRGDMLPVILISGRTDTTTRKRARVAGALAIVEKAISTRGGSLPRAPRLESRVIGYGPSQLRCERRAYRLTSRRSSLLQRSLTGQ